MNDQLLIPTELKAGFNKRHDTYTGQLAFLTYVKGDGTIFYEKTWRQWSGTNGIPTKDIKNVPVEGFVINRNGGGGRSSWHSRQEFIRVWDPRGFEIEITTDNLLFILQECTANKGKGLEGELVYAWQGRRLILLPTSCEEYQNSLLFTDLANKSIEKGDLVQGATYIGKDQKHYVYVGYQDYVDDYMGIKKEFIFMCDDEYIPLAIKKIAMRLGTDIIEDLGGFMDGFYKSGHALPFEKVIVESINIDLSKFENDWKKERLEYGRTEILHWKSTQHMVCLPGKKENEWVKYKLIAVGENWKVKEDVWDVTFSKFSHYTLFPLLDLTITKDKIKKKQINSTDDLYYRIRANPETKFEGKYSLQELKEAGAKTIYVKPFSKQKVII